MKVPFLDLKAQYQSIREEVNKAKNVVILGGGFIGAEFADEIARGSGSKVHIVEMLPKLLNTAFDDEFCDDAEKELEELGVGIHTGRKAVSIEGTQVIRVHALDRRQVSLG